MSEPSRLARAALRRSASDPAYVGYWLARHRQTENLSDDQLAARLGVTVEQMAVLALGRTPSAASFADDLSAVCRAAGANPGAVAGVLRQEQTLAAWSGTPAGETAAGWLLAAHDADQPPDGGAEGGPPDAGRVG